MYVHIDRIAAQHTHVLNADITYLSLRWQVIDTRQRRLN